MTEYPIRNARTGIYTWTPGETMRAALIAHENDRRLAAGELPLSRLAKIGREDTGASVLRAWIGDSEIYGRRENVVRES